MWRRNRPFAPLPQIPPNSSMDIRAPPPGLRSTMILYSCITACNTSFASCARLTPHAQGALCHLYHAHVHLRTGQGIAAMCCPLYRLQLCLPSAICENAACMFSTDPDDGCHNGRQDAQVYVQFRSFGNLTFFYIIRSITCFNISFSPFDSRLLRCFLLFTFFTIVPLVSLPPIILTSDESCFCGRAFSVLSFRCFASSRRVCHPWNRLFLWRLFRIDFSLSLLSFHLPCFHLHQLICPRGIIRGGSRNYSIAQDSGLLPVLRDCTFSLL